MSQTTPERRYASPQQTAEYLGWSTCTVRRKIDSGDIPARRLPGSRLLVIDLNELDELMMPVAATAAAS